MVEKSDEFDECILTLNRQKISYQNLIALRKFWYCIASYCTLLTSVCQGLAITLCRDMESGVLSSHYSCKKDATEDKDPPEGKKLPNLSGPCLSKVIATIVIVIICQL